MLGRGHTAWGLLLVLAGCGGLPRGPEGAGRSGAAEVLDYATLRERILEANHCLECHDRDNPDDADPLSTYEEVLLLVVPGVPEESKLYTSVHSGKMPKKRPKMTAGDQHYLAAWIAAGAPREAKGGP